MKRELLENLYIFLLKEGFIVKGLKAGCFDIVARREGNVLLIKVLEDANSISHEYVEEMNKITSYINAFPLIISEKAGSPLQDNVVYSRFGVYTLNPNTFKNVIKNRILFIKRSHAGLTVSVIGKKLREMRTKYNLSLNELAKKIGVSIRMIRKYENEGAEITLRKAEKVYDLFGDKVFRKINVLETKENIISIPKTIFGKKYTQLGFYASEIKKCPFDIIARKDRDLILTDIGDKPHKGFVSTSKLLDASNLVIFKKKRPKDMPALTKKEFLEFDKANELIKFLKEF